MLILFNNKFIKPEEANISILSESFQYGYGVFETLRTYNKKVFKDKEHIKRLFKATKIIKLEIKYTQEEISSMLSKIAKKSEHTNQRIKVIACKEGIIITSIELQETPELIANGATCKTFNCSRSFPQIKSLSYLQSYIPHQSALEEGYYEAILIDKQGYLLEGAYSNIFWFEKNTLCTTPSEEILHGITRETILDISPFKTKIKKIRLINLLKKQEIFLTQTTKGIVPIIKIDKNKIGDSQPGLKTKQLINELQTYLKKTAS